MCQFQDKAGTPKLCHDQSEPIHSGTIRNNDRFTPQVVDDLSHH